MLTGTTGLIVFMIGFILIILIGQKLKINLGLVAFAFCFIIGGIFNQMSASKIAAYFPTSLFMTQLAATAFFGFIVETGAFKGIVDRLVYRFRNKTWCLPLIMWLATVVVCCLGGADMSTFLIISPIIFQMSRDLKLNPLWGAIMQGGQVAAFGFLPYLGGGAAVHQMVNGFIGEDLTGPTMAGTIITLFIVSSIVLISSYFLFGMHKTKGEFVAEKPAPFTQKQKLTLAVIGVYIAVLVVPSLINALAPNPVCAFISTYFEVRTMCFVGCIVFTLLKIGDARGVIKNGIPWDALVLLAGVCTYVSMSQAFGVIDTISALLSNVSATLLPVFIIIVGGLLSFACNGFVIWPILLALVPTLAEASGLNPIGLAIAAMCSCPFTSVSAMSTGGSMSVVGYDEETRNKIFWKMFIVGIINAVIGCIFAALGWFEWIGNIMAGLF